MLGELVPFHTSLEKRRLELIDYMDRLSEQERLRNPSSSELSPLQVLAHVVRVEETVVGPGTTPSQNSKVGVRGRIFMFTMVNLMRPGFRIPTTPILHPENPYGYEELKRAWDVLRTELKSRVERVSLTSRDQPICDHMMAGPLTARMALDFLDVHLRYHWRNFPRSTR